MSFTVRTALLALLLTQATAARGADTTETFDVGVSDYEFFAGSEGIGRALSEGAFFGETLLGIGLAPRLSGFVALDARGDHQLVESSGGFAFGMFGTPVDTDHFDWDLFAHVHYQPGAITVGPATEFNLDLHPDLALAGLYLRAQLCACGNGNADPAEGKYSAGVEGGAYWTMARGHQLLLEYGTQTPLAELGQLESSMLSLGYNTLVNSRLELLLEATLELPIGDSPAAFGAMAGIIATLPGG
jgi:hypothetical protein